MQETFNWPPLESSPEIFEDYMRSLGLFTTHGFYELYGFDDDLLMMSPLPTYAVILAYERLKDDKDQGETADHKICEFYMKQTKALDNACGVIACLHAIFNHDINNQNELKWDYGSVLAKFRGACEGKNSLERATILENMQEFKEKHSHHASKGQSQQCDEQSQVKHHFVAFVERNGQVMELDGLKAGPQVIANPEKKALLQCAVGEIQRRLGEGLISEQMSVMTLSATGVE